MYCARRADDSGVHLRRQLHGANARQGSPLSLSRRWRPAAGADPIAQRALESFYGIGPKVSQGIMARHFIYPWAKVGALKNSEVLNLTADLSRMKIENDLRREVQEKIRRMKDMGSYRGRRHAMGLPVRGQRTRTQVRRSTRRRLRPRRCCYRKLTRADFDGTQTQQDRARWIGTGADVNGKSVYHCRLLYTRHGTALMNLILDESARLFSHVSYAVRTRDESNRMAAAAIWGST